MHVYIAALEIGHNVTKYSGFRSAFKFDHSGIDAVPVAARQVFRLDRKYESNVL